MNVQWYYKHVYYDWYIYIENLFPQFSYQKCYAVKKQRVGLEKFREKYYMYD